MMDMWMMKELNSSSPEYVTAGRVNRTALAEAYMLMLGDKAPRQGTSEDDRVFHSAHIVASYYEQHRRG